MNQMVNIQYSIDIEELETEVSRLLKRSTTKLDAAVKVMESVTATAKKRTALSSEVVEELSAAREELLTVDRGLQDVVEIISGYINYRLQAVMPAAEDGATSGPSQESMPPDVQKYMDSLNNTLENLSEQATQTPIGSDVELQQKIQEFRTANNLDE